LLVRQVGRQRHLQQQLAARQQVVVQRAVLGVLAGDPRRQRGSPTQPRLGAVGFDLRLGRGFRGLIGQEGRL